MWQESDVDFMSSERYRHRSVFVRYFFVGMIKGICPAGSRMMLVDVIIIVQMPSCPAYVMPSWRPIHFALIDDFNEWKVKMNDDDDDDDESGIMMWVVMCGVAGAGVLKTGREAPTSTRRAVPPSEASAAPRGGTPAQGVTRNWTRQFKVPIKHRKT